MTERSIIDLYSDKAPAADAVPGISGTTLDPAFWQELSIGFTPTTNGWNWNIPNYRGHSVGLTIALMCAWVKARDIAKAGMRLNRRYDRKWEIMNPGDHWFARMLSLRPNTEMSWGDFWRMLVIQLEMTGDGYVLIRRNNRGEVLELIPLQSARCRRMRSTTGRVFYEINTATEEDRGMLGAYNATVPARMIIHLRGKSFNGIDGLSANELGNPIFALANAIQSFQSKLFGSDGKQPMVFEMDGTFGTGDAAEIAYRRLKDQLRQGFARMNDIGEPLLLEAGLKAKPVAVNSRDAMTIDAYNQQVVRICGLMGVPPHKIYHYDTVKYENQASADLQYASDCLEPLADMIEETFRNSLVYGELESYELWPEFDRERMTVLDAKAINERVKTAVLSGLMMLNEGREKLGLNPVEGGDVFMIPVNMALMNPKGEIIGTAAQGQAQNDQNEPDDDQPAVDEPKQARSIRIVQ